MNKDEILFYEVQPSWRKWSVILIVTPTLIVSVWALIEMFAGRMDFHPVAIVIFLLFSFVIYFTTFSKMKTIVTSTGIYVKNTDWLKIMRSDSIFFAWEAIEKMRIYKHKKFRFQNIITLFWALVIILLPYSSSDKEKESEKNDDTFVVSGNIGLQLVLKDGRKILIGTNKVEELKEVINKLNSKKQ